jgi:DNA repair exonuclease SbcCD ATPase subunit
MKLHIKNFCCWTDEVFEFPDDGNVLISAPSGFGKTSIIRSIIFALFGEGRKITQHGKKKCSVELWFRDLHILRTKGPGRLLVNDTYEDEAGQHIINKYFINKMFYLSQDSANSFVMMAPNNKLEYLEQMVFHNIDISSIKSKLTTIIHNRDKDLEKKKTELSTTEGIISEIKIPDKIVLEKKFTDRLNPNGIDKLLNDEKQEYEEYRENYRKFNELTKEIKTTHITINHENELLLKCNEKMEEYDLFINSNNNTEDLLNKYRNKMNYIRKKEEYDKMKSEYLQQKKMYEKTITDERDTLENKIHSLENKIEKEIPFKTLKEGREEIKKYKKFIRCGEEINELLNEKKSIVIPDSDKILPEQEYNELLLSHTDYTNKSREINSSYVCPSCNVFLKIQDNKLTEEYHGLNREDIQKNLCETKTRIDNHKHQMDMKTEYDKKIQYLDTKINHLKKTMTMDEMTMSIAEMEKKYEQHISYQSILNDYYKQLDIIVEKYEQLEKHVNELNKKCKKIKSSLKKLEKEGEKEVEKEDRETIENTIKELEKKNTLYNHYKCSKMKLQEEVNVLDRSISQNTDKMKRLQKQIELLNLSGETDDSKLEEYRNNIDLLSRYKQYHDTKTLYDKYQTKKNKLKSEVKEYEKLLSSSMRFKEKIAEAVSITLTNLINTINTNVQVYLDSFFDTEPLSAVISGFKTVKKTKKPKINIEITYKNNSVDINSLSGGERDRVILAFTLTLSDMTNSPLIILDECVSSLDQGNADNVFHGIKEHCKDKLVILIAHQIITGGFDKIITI